MSGGQGAAASTAWQPHVVALVCNWCTYAGADMAGTTRLQYPTSVRIVRFPCTGRINPLFVIRAFEQGADGVLISGCHPGDCHYVHGNLVARRRAAVLRSLMEFLGLDGRRLHYSWVSASEGAKWARVVDEVTAEVRAAGPLGSWPGQGDPSQHVELPALSEPARARTMIDSEGLTMRVRELAAALLSEGRVGMVIGHGAGPLPGRTAPVFVSDGDQVDCLLWNESCETNLLAYLPRALHFAETVGVVVKRCDTRAASVLLQEHQLRSDQVVLIGVECPGQRDGDHLARKCHTCSGTPTEDCDHAIVCERDGAAPAEKTATDRLDAEIAVLEALPAPQRWAYWQRHFTRCLRCYACRAVCPLCYCSSCIAEKHRPQLVSMAIDGRGNTAWNIIRALHHAGRCSGCGECARVCPAGIRLDLLNRTLEREIEERYGYRAGSDAEAAPVLAEFRMEDSEEFIR